MRRRCGARARWRVERLSPRYEGGVLPDERGQPLAGGALPQESAIEEHSRLGPAAGQNLEITMSKNTTRESVVMRSEYLRAKPRAARFVMSV